MSIANMRALLNEARLQDRAVGAFGVSSIEMICGVTRAADALNTPVILQVAEKRLVTTPLPILGKAMIAAARQARVPVAVHLDHGETLACIKQALDTGFTSVMYDGSAMDMDENITQTLRVMEMAKPYGASVEAEIGRIGKTETGEDSPAVCARPEDCAAFAKRTRVDALAVAIGNAHGVYVGAPNLRFDILEEAGRLCDAALVLHGGTGISDEDFRRAIALGVRKINIATALFQAEARVATAFNGLDYFTLSARMEAAAYEVAHRLIRVFGVAKEMKYMDKLFPDGRELDIIPIGRVAIDFNPTDYNRPLSQSEHFNKYLGGSPANIAVGMARFGRRVGFLGKISDDAFGDFVQGYFEKEGIDVSRLTRCTHGESLGLTFTEILSPDKSGILMYREGAADLQLHPSDVDAPYIASARAVLISGTALCCSPTREAALKALFLARRAGATVIFDADYRAYT